MAVAAVAAAATGLAVAEQSQVGRAVDGVTVAGAGGLFRVGTAAVVVSAAERAVEGVMDRQ